MKIVINRCHGCFELSKQAQQRLIQLTGSNSINGRSDPHLVQVVEELGAKASGEYSYLEVVEIPDEVDWVIKDYDGLEWVAERHRTWP